MESLHPRKHVEPCWIQKWIRWIVSDDGFRFRRLISRRLFRFKMFIFRGSTTVYLGSTPHPVTVTTRIITFLVGNPYKPSFATGWGVDPKSPQLFIESNDFSRDNSPYQVLTLPLLETNSESPLVKKKRVVQRPLYFPFQGKWEDLFSAAFPVSLIGRVSCSL